MRRRSLGLHLALTLSFAASLAAQEPAPPQAQPFAQRMAQVGRLWGQVRYLHPYLAYREIDWDAALMNAIPRIRAASTAGEYGAAVQSMLDALHDPVTRVLAPPAGASTGPEGGAPHETRPPRELYRRLEGDVLYVDFRPGLDLNDPKIGEEGAARLRIEVEKAGRIVVDLRSGPASQPYRASPLDALEIGGLLFRHPIRTPTERYLQHSGYKGQTFAGSGGYLSGFVSLLSQTVDPKPARAESGATPKRTVFLVDPQSEIPPLALALQASGEGALVSVGGPPSEDTLVRTRAFDLGEGVTAQLRLSELVPQEGWSGFKADLEVPALGRADGGDSGLEAARRLALAAPSSGAERGAAPPLPEGSWRPDATYPDQKDPSPEMRLLAVVRLWNVIALFYPYTHLIGDWDAVLPEFLAKMDASKGARGYAWTIAEMAARVADGHTWVAGHPELEELFGVAAPPFGTRWIEGGCVVTALPDGAPAEGNRVEIGDRLESIDGKSIDERLAELQPYVPAATDTALHTRLCGLATLGKKGSTVAVTLLGVDGGRKELRLDRGPWSRTKAGEVVRLLPGNIGYVDLTRLTVPEVPAMFEKLKDARALVFDMRGYPRGTAWAIAPRINTRHAKVAATFRRRIVSGGNTGEEGEAGFFFAQPLAEAPEPKYTGPTVMLIDERAISQSEHSGLFYEAANGTRFIGTPTAGSNGDVTDLTLPGGIGVFFTGHDVRHADGRQLQRIGLVPDVLVAPTRAGLHAGRDEVLDRALQDLESRLTP